MHEIYGPEHVHIGSLEQVLTARNFVKKNPIIHAVVLYHLDTVIIL